MRSRVESENSDKEKKIAQLQDFVARFSAGTRASQVQSRKKAIEKLQMADLKRSNIDVYKRQGQCGSCLMSIRSRCYED